MKYVQIPMTTHEPPTRAGIEEFWRTVDDPRISRCTTYKFGADFLHPEFKKFVYAYQPDPRLVAKIAE
jgi:hypothetical protein